MTYVERPTRLPEPPAELGRLGTGLAWLASAQGAWPPHPPRRPHLLDVVSGEGYQAGCAEADALADEGVDLLVVEASGEPVAALIVLCALLDLEPVVAVGTAASAGWSERLVQVRDGLRAARTHVWDPQLLLTDPTLGRLTGLLAQAPVRKTPVILGGSTVVAAAALVADRLAADARYWWLAGAAPTQTAAKLAAADLVLDPMLDLGLAVPGGAALTLEVLVRGLELIHA